MTLVLLAKILKFNLSEQVEMSFIQSIRMKEDQGNLLVVYHISLFVLMTRSSFAETYCN